MKIVINTIEWEIKEVDSLDGILVVNSRRCKGVCDYGTQIISIQNNLKENIKRQTLAHELTHAFLFQTQIDEKDKYSEEFVCEFLARYAFQILEIVDKYFTSEAKC